MFIWIIKNTPKLMHVHSVKETPIYAVAGRLFIQCRQCKTEMPGDMHDGSPQDIDFWENNFEKREKLVQKWNTRY